MRVVKLEWYFCSLFSYGWTGDSFHLSDWSFPS
jgi:hypothetical protein